MGNHICSNMIPEQIFTKFPLGTENTNLLFLLLRAL